ncbi:MAG: hypothetical protein IJ851_03005 [Eubacterium sp.]|nr:hypothetical protein [Eubacterium sp.]
MAVYTPETKKTRRLRLFMAFVVFALLVVFTLSVNLKTNAFKISRIEEFMTDYDYISCVYDDNVDFAADLYTLNGVSADGIEKVLNYRDFEQVFDAYFGFNITSRANYSEDSYLEFIDLITQDFEKDFTLRLDKHEKEYTSEQLKTVVDSFRNHLIKTVTIDHLSEIKGVTNIGNFASNISLSVSIFLIAAALAITYLLGNKHRRYRSVRAIAIGFISAGIYDIIISIMAVMIFRFKTIDIFPLYLRTQVMRYVYSFIGSIAVTGGVLLFVSLAFVTLAWKMRKGK